MSLFKQFKTDAEVEKKGILLDYGPNKDLEPVDGVHPRIAIRVARAGGSNEAYLKRLEARAKPLRRQIQMETVDRTQLEQLVKDVYAETVVLGWENVTDVDGKLMEFNKQNCIKLFEALPDLFQDIQEQSQRAALYRASIREDDAKN